MNTVYCRGIFKNLDDHSLSFLIYYMRYDGIYEYNTPHLPMPLSRKNKKPPENTSFCDEDALNDFLSIVFY